LGFGGSAGAGSSGAAGGGVGRIVVVLGWLPGVMTVTCVPEGSAGAATGVTAGCRNSGTDERHQHQRERHDAVGQVDGAARERIADEPFAVCCLDGCDDERGDDADPGNRRSAEDGHIVPPSAVTPWRMRALAVSSWCWTAVQSATAGVPSTSVSGSGSASTWSDGTQAYCGMAGVP